jgi:serine protease
MRFIGVFAALAAGLLITQGLNAQGAPDATVRLIVKLKPSEADSSRAQALAVSSDGSAHRISALGQRVGLSQRTSRSLGGDMNLVLLDRPLAGTEIEATLQTLRADPEVEFAEIDQRRYPLAVPQDPLYPEQWYLQADQPAAVNFAAAWDLTTGSVETVIAILDTGIRFDHPDLGRYAAAPGDDLPGHDFVSGESSSSFVSANDGDGWDTDPSDPGDWVSAGEAASGPLARCDESESSWHGTRVTGIAGAITGNLAGIAGGTWNTRILPVRVLGKCGGYDSDIVAAMRWAAGLSVPDTPGNPTPAKILNLSLGGSGNCTNSYRQTITALTAAGVLVVAAAGNEHGPVQTPGNCPGVLAVAGLRHVGTKVGYSSLGSEVGIAAPAGNCVNLSGSPCLLPLMSTSNTGTTVPGLYSYTGNIGTSFSAPIVSAIAGLMHAVNSELSTSEMIARIKSGARPFPASDPAIPTCPALDVLTSQCNCTTTTCGAGMADAPGAVREALRPIARIVEPGSARVGENLVLDGTTSRAARGRNVASYVWSVSGVTADIVGTSTAATATLEISAAGPIDVLLTVTDDIGGDDTAVISLDAAGSSSGGGGGLMHPLLLAVLLAAGLRRRVVGAPSGAIIDCK